MGKERVWDITYEVSEGQEVLAENIDGPNADFVRVIEKSAYDQLLKDALFVFAGSMAIPGQPDADLEKRERAIMRILERNNG